MSLVPYDKSAVEESAAKLRNGLLISLPLTELAKLSNATADLMVEPIKEQSTCSQGCSHCCKQTAIMIDEVDALLLSQVTGRQMEKPDYRSIQNFKGIPCVFLDTTSNSCSVYEHRPLTCRISTSVDDPKKCETEEFRQMVELNSALTEILLLIGMDIKRTYEASRGNSPKADIRQYFRPVSQES